MRKEDNYLRKSIFGFLLGLVTSVGCATSVTYTHVSEKEYPGRAADCQFQIQSRYPDASYEEVGVINLSTDYYGHNGASDLKEFKKLIQNEVCRSGGEMVVPEINGKGYYLKASVFKKIK